MSDGFTFAALGGVAAAEGIKFLYEQAAELLKAWRERRKHTPGDEGEPPELPVPIIGSPALDGQPAQHPADAALVADYYQALITLSGALSPYAQGLADIESGGTALANQAERLRAVLEEIYHQRFTFRGEQREPSGSRVDVRQRFDVAEGTALGAHADVGPGGEIHVAQHVTTLGSGASVTGFTGSVGGGRKDSTDTGDASA